MGTLQGMQEFSRIKDASRRHCSHPHPPQQGVQGFYIYKLWSTYEVPTAHSWTHSLSPFLSRKTAASRINRALQHTPDLPTPRQSSSAGDWTGCLRYLLNSYQLAKTTLIHSLYTGNLYLWELFQDCERQLLCLIHINKIKRQKNIFLIRTRKISRRKS